MYIHLQRYRGELYLIRALGGRPMASGGAGWWRPEEAAEPVTSRAIDPRPMWRGGGSRGGVSAGPKAAAALGGRAVATEEAEAPVWRLGQWRSGRWRSRDAFFCI
jgi:hypothetical protein